MSPSTRPLAMSSDAPAGSRFAASAGALLLRLTIVAISAGGLVLVLLTLTGSGPATRPLTPPGRALSYRQEARVRLTATGTSQSPATSEHQGWLPLPLAARGAMSRSLGADNRSYWASRASSGALVLRNSAQHVETLVDSAGMVVSAGHGMRINLTGLKLGRAGALALVRGIGRGAPERNQIVYSTRGLREWFANGPLGVEQGFMLTRRPSGTGPLLISQELSGGITAHIASDAQSATFASAGESLSYTDLIVTDAAGHPLPTRLTIVGRRLVVSIDDAHAVYPLHVDPVIQQTPCVIIGDAGCQSTDPQVTLDATFTSDATGCTFGISVDWGDGTAVQSFDVPGGPAGSVPFATHTYSSAAVYTITQDVSLLAGHCTTASGTNQFTLHDLTTTTTTPTTTTSSTSTAPTTTTTTTPTASSGSQTFSGSFGQAQTFPVPTGVTKFTITLVGGGGGGNGGFGGFDSFPATPGAPGGSGETLVATLTVPAGTPSISLITGAGGSGGVGQPVGTGDVGGEGGAGDGDGGQGGPLVFPGLNYFSYGGGGGGGSAVSVDGTLCLLAAGGGGGGGPAYGGKGAGGAGGIPDGQVGQTTSDGSGGGGGGATQTAPGGGGAGVQAAGQSGAGSNGGAGGPDSNLGYGGGGGGGYFGGGGGGTSSLTNGNGAGGGGASGFDEPTATDCSVTSPQPSLATNGGTGGTSTPPTGSIGANGGNGSVTISWSTGTTTTTTTTTPTTTTTTTTTTPTTTTSSTSTTPTTATTPTSTTPTTTTTSSTSTTASVSTTSTSSTTSSSTSGGGGVLGSGPSTGRLTPAQQLAKAVAACNKLKKVKKRSACIAAAEARYKAQELAAALKACDKLKKTKKRAACVSAARLKYGIHPSRPVHVPSDTPGSTHG